MSTNSNPKIDRPYDGNSEGWQLEATAPKDGTVFEASNPQMDITWLAQWGIFYGLLHITGRTYDDWIVFKDGAKFMPLRPGAGCRFDCWRPVEDPEAWTPTKRSEIPSYGRSEQSRDDGGPQ